MPTKTRRKSPLERDPIKEVTEELRKVLEMKTEAPSIEDELEAATQALDFAKSIKTKKMKNHHCTECGNSGVQLYNSEARNKGKGHFKCYISEDGEYCDEHGEPFTDPDILETLKEVKTKGKVR